MSQEHTIQVPGHRLYLDESGDHRYENLDQIPCRYLTLLGCIFEREKDYVEMSGLMSRIKSKFWPNIDPDKPVIFHREDMVRKRGYFHIFKEPFILEDFNKSLLELLQKSNYTIINVTLDKATHLQKYKYPDHPYKYCVNAMMERYVLWLMEHSAKGDVMAESRGKEDLHLKGVFRQTWEDGTRFRSADFFQNSLTSKEIKIKPKAQNIAGLQIADILAYPLKEKLLWEHKIRTHNYQGLFSETIWNAVKQKVRARPDGNMAGYGEIFII